MNIITIAFVCFCFTKCTFGQNYLSYVCHSFSDYKITRELNRDCYYSGDVRGSFEKIAQSYGYNTQVHEIITEDQYILTLFRISHAKSRPGGPPVLLVHGAISSATAFALVGNHSLAFLLADEGYDVWVANLRGTTYSDNHLTLNIFQKEFWNFTFHDHGIYDLKSIIHLVTSTSKQKVIYIGWSLGATAYYVYNIKNPDHALQNVRVSISLGPTIYLHLATSPILKIFELIPYWILKVTFDKLVPLGVFFLKTPAFVDLILTFCFDSPFQALFCEFAKSLLTGFNIQQEAPEVFPVFISQCIQPFNLKMGYYAVQLAKSRDFREFDYGTRRNLIFYGTPNPPPYNISLINLPIYIIYGANDFLGAEDNVKLFHHNLPEIAKPFGKPYRVKDEKFCHSDMVAAKDVKALLNDHIIEFLKENEVYFNN